MTIKVVILEDEAVLGQLYKKKLEKANFEVKWVEKTTDVQKAIDDLKPEIVLLDHSISGEEKSGMDLIPNIKKVLPSAKIIMLSNYSDFHLKEKALKAGADDYLLKIDNSPKALVQYIKNILQSL